jgi:DNA-binding CsgD family transcriptional regulator
MWGHKGCVFGAMDLTPQPSALAQQVSWSRVAAHIAAGLRLRRRLKETDQPEPDAILSPDGKVVHAEGTAKVRSARDILRDAAVAVERARGPMRRKDPLAAAELWRGMVDGRWSLVDRFDRDGRRFIVAHRNGIPARGARALSGREKQVLSYVALAHPNKLIAYELGLSISTVGMYVTSALAKLRIDSRVEFVKLASAFGPAERSAGGAPQAR